MICIYKIPINCPFQIAGQVTTLALTSALHIPNFVNTSSEQHLNNLVQHTVDQPTDEHHLRPPCQHSHLHSQQQTSVELNNVGYKGGDSMFTPSADFEEPQTENHMPHCQNDVDMISDSQEIQRESSESEVQSENIHQSGVLKTIQPFSLGGDLQPLERIYEAEHSSDLYDLRRSPEQVTHQNCLSDVDPKKLSCQQTSQQQQHCLDQSVFSQISNSGRKQPSLGLDIAMYIV